MTWVLFLHVYVFIINEVGCTGQLVQFTTPELCWLLLAIQFVLCSALAWVGWWHIPRPAEAACRVMTSQFVIFIRVPGSVISPDISISRNIKYIHPLHSPQAELKQKIWWTYLNVEKTKEALLVLCAFLVPCFYREGKSRNLCLLNIKLDLHGI